MMTQIAATTTTIITPPAITAFPKTSPELCFELKPKNIKNAAKNIAISESAFIFLYYVSLRLEIDSFSSSSSTDEILAFQYSKYSFKLFTETFSFL